MATVYLETSFISACVTDRSDLQSLARKQMSLDWWQSQLSRDELYISAEVLRELSDPEFRHRDAGLQMVEGIPQLTINDAVLQFATTLVRERSCPDPLLEMPFTS